MSQWWDNVRKGRRFETYGIVFSEHVHRVLSRIAKSDETPENLDALETLFRELHNGIPASAAKIRADIPIYTVMVGPYRVTLAVKRGNLWVDRITRLADLYTSSTSN